MPISIQKKSKIPIIRQIQEGRFFFLVISLLAYFALTPLMAGFVGVQLLFDVFLSAVVVSGIYAVSTNRRQRVITTIIAVPLFINLWLYRLIQIDFIPLAAQLLLVIFLVYSIACLLSFIFRAPTVTPDVIYAAIENKDDFKKAIVKYRQRRSVVILLQRGDQGYYITLKL